MDKTVLPMAVTTYESSEVTEELRRLYGETGDAALYLTKNPIGGFSVEGERLELSAEEQKAFMRAGRGGE